MKNLFKNIHHSLLKSVLIFLVIGTASFHCSAQIRFEPGYFISNAGEKTECLIRNQDWSDTPEKFEYKLSPDSEVKMMRVEDVKELIISGQARYVRALVQIDRSSNNTESLTKEKAPIFRPESLFLRVLVEGEASLFEFRQNHLVRFFYKTTKDSISQLVYKRYIVGTTSHSQVYENAQFRQQLYNDVSCPGTTVNEMQRIRYKREDLERIFKKYNACHSQTQTPVETKPKIKENFSLTIRPGFNIVDAYIVQTFFNIRFDLAKTGSRLGAELEYILPFNKRKWSITLEPTYQRFNNEKEVKNDLFIGGKSTAIIDYTSLELPLTARHSFFVGTNSRIFVNLSYVVNIPISSSDVIILDHNDEVFRKSKIPIGPNYAMGLGFNHTRWNIEVRYLTRRKMVEGVLSKYYGANYGVTSVILGYSLFRK